MKDIKIKGWIAKDGDNSIRLFNEKPYRNGDRWEGNHLYLGIVCNGIKVQKTNPTEVELTIMPIKKDDK